MKSIKLYIKTFRPRTLPLSVSGIVLGSLLAASEGHFNVRIFILAILTTLSLQILSNVSNELGDAQKGTDTADRKGPAYVLLSGALTQKDFYRLIAIFGLLSVVFGSLLVYVSLDYFFSKEGLIMLAFGGLAVLASITYTLGKNPYGYKGWGDLFVFLFFGLLSTLGSYFLQCGQLPLLLLLPASACGFLITGVLNLNNIRDMETDKINRITLPLVLGKFIKRGVVEKFDDFVGSTAVGIQRSDDGPGAGARNDVWKNMKFFQSLESTGMGKAFSPSAAQGQTDSIWFRF
jgi:1,4-dihydroxy-2-naphthoate octaprenyltransferase